MANLSNINNKLIVTDGGNLLVNATANLATYGGITIDNFSDPSIAMKTTGASGWLWTQYITSSGTNNFSMGVNQSSPYWCVKAGAGMDSPHLVVDSSGDVGIGTITPDRLLEISHDTASHDPVLRLTGTSTGGYAAGIEWQSGFGPKTSAQIFSTASGSQGGELWINVRDQATNALVRRMYFKNNGNVGIGTSSPDAKLTIADPGGATTRSIQIEGNNSVSGMNGTIGYFAGGLYISNNYYYNSAQVHPISTYGQTNIVQQTSTITGGNFIDFNVSDHTDPNNAPDTRMRILDSGNVGIGVTVPGARLELDNPSAFTNMIEYGNVAWNQSTGHGLVAVNRGSDGYVQLQITSGVDNADVFTIRNSGTGANIQHNFLSNGGAYHAGNVGIGTSTPQRKLHVTNSADGFISRFTGGANSDVNIGIFGHSTANFGSIGTESNDRFSLFTNGIDRLNIANGGDVTIPGNIGIGTTLPYERLSVNGVVSIRAAYNDPNMTVTSNGMTPQQSGSLEINQGYAGTTANGDTIVFKYEATSWKSWQFEYCISAAYGLSKGGAGGYLNNGTPQAYYYTTINQGSNVNVTSVVATNGGGNNQHLIVTITGSFGIHPVIKMKYTQGGGDGAPRADRASLTFNS